MVAFCRNSLLRAAELVRDRHLEAKQGCFTLLWSLRCRRIHKIVSVC